ncbi:Transposase, partial [Phytophthora megakarya]
EYLGHELSSEGVRPLERLVTAVKDFPTPMDAVEVKRFIHLAGYYRRFVAGFGSMMAPLSRLLRKKVHWEWGDEQKAAFDNVKAVVTSKPLLAYPDFRLPFTLVTDASKVGLGACLMQDQGNGPQPVSYASKVASETEAKYGITELECLAVVWAIKLYRPYLYGRRFTIVTYHSALKWLMMSPNLAGKLHRWALTLQKFDFEVQYRLGSTNVVADALSRAPVMATVRAVVGRQRRRRRAICASERKARPADANDTMERASRDGTDGLASSDVAVDVGGSTSHEEDEDQAVHPLADVRSSEDDAAVATCREAVNDTTDDDSAVFGVNGGDGKFGMITDDEDLGTSDMATAATGENSSVATCMDTATYLEAVTTATDDQSSDVVTLEEDLTYEATTVARGTVSPVSGLAVTTENSIGGRRGRQERETKRVTFAVPEDGEWWWTSGEVTTVK